MMDDDENQEQRVERIMARERHRPFPYSNDGLETATLIYDLTAESARLRAEAANSAAQRDEAVLRATQAEERLRAVEADLATAWADRDKARIDQREMALQALASMGQAQEAYEAQLVAEAELARIRAADRTSIPVRTTEAAKMRKGQAI